MAISKIPGAGVSADTLEAGAIAANAIGASELADNAVDTAAIATNAVTATEIAADAVGESELSVDYTTVKPHIQPGVLYPAYKGTLIDTADPVAASTPEDKSDAAMAITSIDNYTIGTDDPKNGLAYLKTNTTTGSGGSNLTIGDDNDADFQFGTGAFTIEYWVKETDYNYGDHGHMSTSQGAVGWAINLSGEYIYFTAQGDAFGSAPTSGNKIIARANRSGHVSDGTWYHVAIVRVSTSNLKIYINGTDRTAEADAGGTYGWGWDNTSNDHNLVLGRAYPAADEKHTVGGFDDLRITKGLAVYTGNFTAPTSTLTKTWSAGTNIAANSTASNVKLLMTSENGGIPDHSGAYGTAQSDGKKYYYTDIKGSKPIKDPRIGAHFGSQRHTVRSIQLQEQETGEQLQKVYAADGRSWFRFVDDDGRKWGMRYNSNGTMVRNEGSNSDGLWFELTGYFNDFNIIVEGGTGLCNDIDLFVNGSTSQTGNTELGGNSTRATPLGGRYVSNGSVITGGSTLSASLGTTPTINTLKFLCTNAGSEYIFIHGVELVAQDTTSTANRSKIQIPTQNVVSYGKKFALSAAAQHYDPFNGFTNGTSLHSAFVDTATSLGLDSAPGSSAKWAISNSNNIRPYNGGRIIKWIASDGTIKTSVNMMPPNAQNYPKQASNEITTPSATNTTTTPNMSDDAIDQSLAEVAKTFHYREFGNGSQNQGTGGSNHADFSMNVATATDDHVYCMDDGLTQMWGEDVRDYGNYDILPYQNGDFLQLVFIGTGISFFNTTATGNFRYTIAQNLPYGTHIIQLTRNGDDKPDIIIDGITMADVAFTLANGSVVGTYASFGEVTFHQPKKPPIPEDACIIADYMLMADFVKQTNPSGDNMDHSNYISKGVRACSHSRDVHYEETTGGYVFGMDTASHIGWYLASNSTSSGADNNVYSLPAFANNFVLQGHSSNTKNDIWIDGSDVAQSGTTGNGHSDISYPDAAVTLGLHDFQILGKANQDYAPYISGKSFMFATPTHTSSHYQPFETPYLHELVGGDRNMEQHNLVVTADGKTWDEVTRDTSYIGNLVAYMTTNTTTAQNVSVIFDDWRGSETPAGTPMFNKQHFTIAHDRLICLTEGQYTIWAQSIARASGTAENTAIILINGTIRSRGYTAASSHSQVGVSHTEQLKRGDYVQIWGGWFEDVRYSYANITKLS